MAEISDIKSTDREIDILHPGTREPIGIKVGVMHIDDPRLKKIKRNIRDEAQRLQQRGKFIKAEEVEENTNNLLFAAMTHWTWGKDAEGEQNTFDGEVPEFNRRNVLAVLNQMSWFAGQIAEAIDEEEAFFTKSKKN